MLLGTVPAAACIARGHYYTLRGAWPAPDASEAPLDTPLAFQLQPDADELTFMGSFYDAVAPLRVEATGDEVAVRMAEIGTETKGVFSFVPLAPLAPHTTYVVDFDDLPPQPGSPNEPGPTSWRFTTGDAPAPTLRLEGEITVAYELGSDPVFDCPNGPGICGPTCAATSMRDVTRARVSLPAAFDGYAAVGMKGELKISEQVAPGAANGRIAYAFTSPDLGKSSEALVTMPEREDGAAYSPCFEYTVTDASEHDIITSFCASSPYPLAGELRDAPAGEQPPRGPRTSKACAFAPTPRSGSASSFTALALAALLVSRRRRSRNAP